MFQASRPSSTRHIAKIAGVALFWTLISIHRFFAGLSILNSSEFSCDTASLNAMNFFAGSIVSGLTSGVIGGTVMVLLWEKWLRSRQYSTALALIFVSYCGIYIVVALTGNVYLFSTTQGYSLNDPMLWSSALSYITQLSGIENFFFWLMVVALTMIAFLVNDKYGPGVFISFLRGKYFHPTREERIFMFLDLRSSTSIAEQLGEVDYFRFLREVFQDVTPSILQSKGEIYQYVGDEIVISWKPQSGLRNANCVHCFFEIQKALKARSAHYRSTYGFEPEFKAGLHYGYVVAGEIGVVKREIAFSGDVLNTAARIQAKCNELKVNILLSKKLWDTIDSSQNIYKKISKGSIPLRGKKQSLELVTVSG